jgi:hypothetical protein
MKVTPTAESKEPEPEQKADPVVQPEVKPEVKAEPAKTTQESVSDDPFFKF